MATGLVIISQPQLLLDTLQLPGSTTFLNDVAVNNTVSPAGTKVSVMFKGLPEYDSSSDVLTLP